MPRGACDCCRAHKIRCDQKRPICKQCHVNRRQCQYVYSDTMKKSCLACRIKKKRCDNKKPECSTCVTSGKPCSYQKDYDITQISTISSTITNRKKHHDLDFILCANLKFKQNENFIEYDYSTHQLLYLEGKTVTIVPSIFLCDLYFGQHQGKNLLVDGRALNSTTFKLPSSFKSQNLLTQQLVSHLVEVFFNRLNCHHPILPKSYFCYLMRSKSVEPSSRLLLYSICLASLTLFPCRRLCALLRQFFSDSFFNMLKKCYLSPSLPLVLAYTILSLLSPYDICCLKAKSQSFYFQQSQILVPLLGLHVNTPLLNMPRHIVQFRNVLSFSTFSGELFTSNFIFSNNQSLSAKLLDPSFFSFGPHDNNGINPPPCSPAQSIDRPCDFICNYLIIRHLFILSSSASSLLKEVKTQKTVSGSNTESTFQSLLILEISLHNLYYGNPVNSDYNALKNQEIQIPTNHLGIHNFVNYLNQLLDFYRPLIHLLTLSTIEPCLKGKVLVHDFLSWTPEQKVLATIYFLREALSAHSLYFIDSSFTHKWWSICSNLLFVNSLNSQIKKHNCNFRVSQLVSGCLQVLHNTLELGKERTDIAKFISDNAICMVKKPKTLVTVISNNNV